MLKKLLVSLLIAATMLSMAACNKEDEKKDEGTTAADAATTAADAATTEKKEEATTKKETEATTPKETEPPKEYNYEVVWALDLSKYEDGAEIPFTLSAGVTEAYIEGGVLKGTSNGADPYLTYKKAEGEEVAIDTTKVNCIRIKFFNYTEAYEGQMFFGFDGGGFNEPDSHKIFWEMDASMDDNDVQIYEFDPTVDMNGGEWRGALNSWRIDPFNGNTAGDFDIYSVEFCTKTEK